MFGRNTWSGQPWQLRRSGGYGPHARSWEKVAPSPYGSQRKAVESLKMAAKTKRLLPSNMFMCSSIDEWLNPEADNYQGLCVSRPMDPLRWQPVADELSMQMPDSMEDRIHTETIDLTASEDLLQQRFEDAATQIAMCLPEELAEIVHKDAKALAETTKKLVPQAQELVMKLELFGPRVCGRWHTDHYVCRSIATYNLRATEYTADSNVNMYELNNCGNNDHIIRDKSQIRSINVGDILLIKGLNFPGKARSLVHKSPQVSYADGKVQGRIVLKVDVMHLGGGYVQNYGRV